MPVLYLGLLSLLSVPVLYLGLLSLLSVPVLYLGLLSLLSVPVLYLGLLSVPVLYLGLCCSPVCASAVYDCVVQVLLSSHTQAFVSQVKKVLSLGSINLCVKVNIETDLLANVE